MTNRQSKSNPAPPTRREVRWAILEAVGALAVYVWMWWGDGLHATVGLIGWTLIMFHTTGKAFDVTRARGRMLMELTAERARNTGTWEEDGGGRFTVRWEPSVGYYVQGFLGEHRHHGEEVLVDEADVISLIRAREDSGEFTAWDDEGTRGIRARLDLPGWDGDQEHPLVTEIKAGTHPLGGPLGDLWDEPVRDLTAYRNRFKPGPY